MILHGRVSMKKQVGSKSSMKPLVEIFHDFSTGSLSSIHYLYINIFQFEVVDYRAPSSQISKSLVRSSQVGPSLVGGWDLPLWKMMESVGMMTFPTEWRNKKKVPNHQPLFGCYSLYWSYSSHCHVVGKILVAPWLHVSYSECGYWTAESLRIAPSMYHWIDYMNPFSQYIIMIYIYICC